MSDTKEAKGRPSRKDFRRVRNEGKDDKAATKENEVRVVASRGQRMYIKYAIDILTGGEGKTKHDSVILTGMGNAVYNVVNVCEIVKRRVKGLHQTTDISSQTLTDKYEAVEEGKDGMEVERKVSVIEVNLSVLPLDVNHYGYQPPLPESEVTEQDERATEERRERPPRRGRGGGDREGGRGEGRGRGGRRDDRDDRPARGGRGGDRRRDDRDDRPAGRGGRGGDRRRDDRDDRAPRGGRGGDRRRDDRDDRPSRGGRGGDRRRDDYNDRPPTRGGRRDDRDDRGPRGGDRRRDDFYDRAPTRGGRRDDRDDRRPPRRDDRDDRAPPRGRGGYSEGRREGGGRGRSDRGGRQ